MEEEFEFWDEMDPVEAALEEQALQDVVKQAAGLQLDFLWAMLGEQFSLIQVREVV